MRFLERGRLPRDCSADSSFADLEHHGALIVLPLTAGIALESRGCGAGFPSDAADQPIAATAREHGLQLATFGGRIRRAGVLSIV